MPPISTFAPRLMAWQRQYGRHDLPWQRTHDPYRIWLSEIMLQQTQVVTVIPYYIRFIARFPDVFALAAAPLDEVMALWSGLGYYSRARNLHRCAQIVTADYDGRFPTDTLALAKLPGIGRSTAAAIAAFAFGARTAILDGNVKRVLTRVFGIEGFPGDIAIENTLWRLAESLLPESESEIATYTQGLMDFGAMLCTRIRPHCVHCPFQQECIAHTSGREHELPATRPKKALPIRHILMLILRARANAYIGNSGNREREEVEYPTAQSGSGGIDPDHERLLTDSDAILLEKRPPVGIWGGLWSLPEAADEAALVASARYFGTVEPLPFITLTPITHTFTHFKLIIQPKLATLPATATPAPSPNVADMNHTWIPLRDIAAYGLPTPVRRLITLLQQSRYFSMSNEDSGIVG